MLHELVVIFFSFSHNRLDLMFVPAHYIYNWYVFCYNYVNIFWLTYMCNNRNTIIKKCCTKWNRTCLFSSSIEAHWLSFITDDTHKSDSDLDLHLEIDSGGILKSKLYSSVAIFQHHQRMEFTFQNSYVNLEFVPSWVIFWTELSCSRKCYSSKATLLLG